MSEKTHENLSCFSDTSRIIHNLLFKCIWFLFCLQRFVLSVVIPMSECVSIQRVDIAELHSQLSPYIFLTLPHCLARHSTVTSTGSLHQIHQLGLDHSFMSHRNRCRFTPFKPIRFWNVHKLCQLYKCQPRVGANLKYLF